MLDLVQIISTVYISGAISTLCLARSDRLNWWLASVAAAFWPIGVVCLMVNIKDRKGSW